METKSESIAELMCPSAQPDLRNGVVVGVVGGTVREPRVAYLKDPLRVNETVLELASPVKPTEVFRLAAPCANEGCRHFDGASCRLARRIVDLLDTVVPGLPSCHLRSTCRWWKQEGADACLRCPQIVTELYGSTPIQQRAARP